MNKALNLKIERIHPDAIMPTRGSVYSAGLDLTAVGYDIVEGGVNGVVIFKTGLKMEIPEGYFGAIYIRSGLSKKGLWTLANNVGVVDSDYRGEIMVMFRYIAGSRFTGKFFFDDNIKKLIGTRIAQLVIQPYSNVIIKAVKSVSKTVRNEGGLGSTGK